MKTTINKVLCMEDEVVRYEVVYQGQVVMVGSVTTSNLTRETLYHSESLSYHEFRVLLDSLRDTLNVSRVTLGGNDND